MAVFSFLRHSTDRYVTSFWSLESTGLLGRVRIIAHEVHEGRTVLPEGEDVPLRTLCLCLALIGAQVSASSATLFLCRYVKPPTAISQRSVTYFLLPS